jgi:hypothetical protein
MGLADQRIFSPPLAVGPTHLVSTEVSFLGNKVARASSSSRSSTYCRIRKGYSCRDERNKEWKLNACTVQYAGSVRMQHGILSCDLNYKYKRYELCNIVSSSKSEVLNGSYLKQKGVRLPEISPKAVSLYK